MRIFLKERLQINNINVQKNLVAYLDSVRESTSCMTSQKLEAKLISKCLS